MPLFNEHPSTTSVGIPRQEAMALSMTLLLSVKVKKKSDEWLIVDNETSVI